jgi:flagellar motor switch protein FliG
MRHQIADTANRICNLQQIGHEIAHEIARVTSPLDGDSKSQRKTAIQIKKNLLMKKNKHNFYSDVVKKLTSLSSPMLCGNHFSPFSPISQVEQWPQAKPAAIYQAKC